MGSVSGERETRIGRSVCSSKERERVLERFDGRQAMCIVAREGFKRKQERGGLLFRMRLTRQDPCVCEFVSIKPGQEKRDLDVDGMRRDCT